MKFDAFYRQINCNITLTYKFGNIKRRLVKLKTCFFVEHVKNSRVMPMLELGSVINVKTLQEVVK